jgi:hypothetical protein
MIDYNQNIDILPSIISSTGYYQVTQDSSGCLVRYYQSVALSRRIEGWYAKRLKKETLQFFEDLMHYINTVTFSNKGQDR